MAIDSMKSLGSLLNSGAPFRGSSSNILGSVLGAALGGGLNMNKVNRIHDQLQAPRLYS